jgi:hypothetical protein
MSGDVMSLDQSDDAMMPADALLQELLPSHAPASHSRRRHSPEPEKHSAVGPPPTLSW